MTNLHRPPTPSRFGTLVATAILLFAAMPAAANQHALDAASRLSADGRHAAAETAYTDILGTDARNLAARIGRAFARSWQKNYAGATTDFREALAQDPGNLPARNGLAYTLAWSGRHAEAEAEFKRALDTAPGDFDAAKGLAYVALWRGDSATAVARFRSLTERHPENAELFVGLGQAQLGAGDRPAAQAAFERALALEPGRADAKGGLEASGPAAFQRGYGITAYYGHNRFGNGVTDSGLRFAELAVQATPALRLWLQYDKGLARDNVDFVRRNVNADAYYIGGLLSYGGQHETRLDLGRRNLDAGIRQNIVRFEQALRLKGGITPKAGVWIADSSGTRTEYTVHTGVSVPVTHGLRIEPMVFYAENRARERELRGLLFGEYSFAGGAKVGIGVSDGRRSNAANRDARHDVFVTGSVPLLGPTRLNLLARRESGAGLPPADLIALGLSYSF